MKYTKLLKMLSEDASYEVFKNLLAPVLIDKEIQYLLYKNKLKFDHDEINKFAKTWISDIVKEDIDDTTLMGIGHGEEDPHTQEIGDHKSLLADISFSPESKEDHMKHLEELLTQVNERLSHMSLGSDDYDAWYILKMLTKKSLSNLKNNKEDISVMYFDMPESLVHKIKRWFGVKQDDKMEFITPEVRNY